MANNGMLTVATPADRVMTLTQLFDIDSLKTVRLGLQGRDRGVGRSELPGFERGRGPIPRRIGAVLAGFAAIFILSTATDIVLHATGVFPPWGQPMAGALFLLALVYRTVYGIAGSYLTARLAPNRPMSHAVALGVVGVLVSLAATVATWNAGPAFGPKWYPISLIIIAVPCAWAGGLLKVHFRN